ncbi:MAG: VOC family protein [Armatimonadetes bacterium]|nr:VOC family protein [Armatimonadota bacterium]
MLKRRAQETLYYVDDLDAAIAFYTGTLGLSLIEKFDFGFALIDADGLGSTIGLMSASLHGADDLGHGHPRPRLVFQVEDVEAQVEDLKSKGVTVTAVSGEKGQTRAAHFYDPDGNPFFIWEDGSAEF